MKKTKNSHPIENWADGIEETIGSYALAPPDDLSSAKLKQVREKLGTLALRLTQAVDELDPVRQPNSIFDPANPKVIARVVALALLSQPRTPLAQVPRFYGSGIYAIYYKGTFDAYAPIAGKDHPIYVGKADPSFQQARTATEQGEKLATRLSEHLKSISKARNLNVQDFECRFLVVASGWQEAAERHLIHLYQPVWNKETKICYGIGKHGDSAETRGNKRSPWDTLHSGRSWAGETVADQIPEPKIRELLAEHFREYPPLQNREQAMDQFLDEMSQH